MKLSADLIILIGFLLRVVVAFWNGFFGPSFGADLDAVGLNGYASTVAVTGKFDEFYIGFTPYTNLLGLIYSYTINHVFVGSLFSCFVWWVSAYIFYKSLLLLSFRKPGVRVALFVYALLPSSIMFTSITIREPFQIFFVNLAIYAILKIYLQRVSKHWFTLIIALAGAGSLHGGLLAFSIFTFAGALLLVSIPGEKRMSWIKLGLMGGVAVVILWYGFSYFGDFSYKLDDGVGSSIESYQRGLLDADARTNYKSTVDISNFGGMLFFVPAGLFQYFFEPFPWHISAASDIVALLENVLRGWLIWKTWKAWKILRTAPSQQRKVFLFLFILYFAMETIWSIGTINWGTSIRHHLPAWSLLLLSAYAMSYGKARVKLTIPLFQKNINWL